jgi:hypothetical protein
MSYGNTRVNTGVQTTTDVNVSKIFIWNNRYETDNETNNYTYSTLSLYAGTVMGRVRGTGVLVPSKASAVDGSDVPVGILAHDLINMIAGETRTCTVCIAGDAAQEQLIFIDGDTLDTVVNGRRYRDRIQGDTAGIILRSVTGMTDYDN